MEMIINHMNRSLNIIKPRDKCSKGTRTQTVEKSVKAKLSQTSKNKALTHIWQDTQWHSRYCHGKMHLQWLIHDILNTVISTSLAISCFSVVFFETVNHDAEHSGYKSYSLFSTVMNLALIYHMKLKNINLPKAKVHKHKGRDEKQSFVHNLLGTMQYKHTKCTLPPPLIWFAKEMGIDNPSAYWCLYPLTW